MQSEEQEHKIQTMCPTQRQPQVAAIVGEVLTHCTGHVLVRCFGDLSVGVWHKGYMRKLNRRTLPWLVLYQYFEVLWSLVHSLFKMSMLRLTPAPVTGKR